MCTTVIVGKNVSKTGRVIVGHNEDQGGRSLHQQFFVPAAHHTEDEWVTGEPTAARIPQVPQTLAYYWSNMLMPAPGSSFDQGFFNEAGVAICSNGGGSSYSATLSPEALELQDGGIGFLLRRLVAERAKNAREAVQIAVELIEQYGYRGDARNYTFADANEAWMLNVVKGRHYVAKRIPDDAVMLISNSLAIRHVDLSDTENVIASPDLISFAIESGHYQPHEDGQYEDFDFAHAYQDDFNRTDPMRSDRMRIGWKAITGVEYTDPLHYPEILAPQAPMGIEDVRAVLRLTNPDTYAERGDGKADAFHVSARDISRSHTRESWVVEFMPNPVFHTLWRCTGPQDTGVYLPWFPLCGAIPDGYQWTSIEASRAEQFQARPEWLTLDFSRHYWTYAVVSELVNFNRGLFAGVFPVREALEVAADQCVQRVREECSQQPHDVIQTRLAQLQTDCTQKAIGQYRALLSALNRIEAEVLTPSVTPDTPSIDIALYPSVGFDPEQIDVSSLRWSLGFTGAKPSALNPIAPIAASVKTLQGRRALVLTFCACALLEHVMSGLTVDTYLRGLARHQRFVAMIPLTIGQSTTVA